MGIHMPSSIFLHISWTISLCKSNYKISLKKTHVLQSISFNCCNNAPLGNRNETTVAKSAHRNQKFEDVQNCFIFSATLSNKERIDIIHTSKITPILKESKDNISIPYSSNKLPSDMWSLNLLHYISKKLSEHACMKILVPSNHLNHFVEVVSKSCA